MSPLALWLNGLLRRVPVWPGYVLGFVPAGIWFWQAVSGRLGADPVRALEHELGLFALQLLIAALCVSPILHLTRINLIRFRRMIGLMAFYYACLHFATWVLLDLQMRWGEIWTDLTKRPYIVVGTLALLLLVPVAASSNDWSIRRLGAARWGRLHMLVYPATILAAAHFVWLVKSWPPEPLIYAAVVLALVAYRPARRIAKRRMRHAAA